MKMVKSLLLGSAAGIVAIAGAQAADLPVKAKPVQYVKICSLYGVGFYYIPGTDMCLKIGGWVRAQYMFGIENGTNGPLTFATAAIATGGAANAGNTGTYNRLSDDGFLWRSRGYITADARQQTAYGTARAYIAVGRSTDMGGAFSSNRAFIQWAGFTFGLAQSIYDFYSGPAVSYYGGQIIPASDTGDAGNWELAYTAQLGNGWSVSIAAEDDRLNRATAIWNTTIAGGDGLTPVAAPTNRYGSPNVPDLVANVRIDAAWGAWQVMGALHNVRAQYDNVATGTAAVTTHPDDQWGWAAGMGLKLNNPFQWGKGDYLQIQANYTVGALGYVFAGRGNLLEGAFRPGGKYAFGLVEDAVYTGSTIATGAQNRVGFTSLDLTTSWGVNASYEHYWNTQWKTSLYGVYDRVEYDNSANSIMCSQESQSAGFNTAGGHHDSTTTGHSSPTLGNGACNNNWSYWAVGSRTQWNVTPQFYMGVDVVYANLHTALRGEAVTVAGVDGSGQTQGARNVADAHAWIGYFRVHYDFYP